MNTTGAGRTATLTSGPWRTPAATAPALHTASHPPAPVLYRVPVGAAGPGMVLSPDAVTGGELANWVTGHLARWRLERLATGLRMVARELARNALEHGAAPARATLVRRPDGRVRVAVTDAGPGFDPAPLRSRWDARRPDDPGGGLALVAAVSTDWGVDRLLLGHRVWADLAPDSPGRALLRLVP
ncbi:ATP-binding protein [Kitasatospora cineracea]|uniref:Histidine kinase-like protein n=1 Tax=Kitasatospora cineracea TaxID=88074 RepID=A0A8G1ULS3_9ACTN|nr:ATP-binding protein [Kitasatospora cineracea]ROR46405.1 histidine kinase-like protein [Kitasatospora cineracea]